MENKDIFFNYEIVTNKDRLGGVKFPRTLSQAVILDEDLTLDTKIDIIDNNLDYLNYAINPLIIKSFTLNDNEENLIYPMGTTLEEDLMLKWEINKDLIKSQYLNDIQIEDNIRELSYSINNFDSTEQNKYDFTLKVNSFYENLPNVQKTISLSFLNYVYYGVAPLLEYSEIHEVFNYLQKKFIDKRQGLYTVKAHNTYIYFAIPSRLIDENDGERKCIFNYNGFLGGFDKLGEYKVQNETGFEENYDIYRSVQFNLGLTTFKVD